MMKGSLFKAMSNLAGFKNSLLLYNVLPAAYNETFSTEDSRLALISEPKLDSDFEHQNGTPYSFMVLKDHKNANANAFGTRLVRKASSFMVQQQ